MIHYGTPTTVALSLATKHYHLRGRTAGGRCVRQANTCMCTAFREESSFSHMNTCFAEDSSFTALDCTQTLKLLPSWKVQQLV